jgi:hypothetical protein
MRPPKRLFLYIALAALLPCGSGAQSSHEEAFSQRVRPVLQEYCNKCHSTEKQKGDLDLEVFTSPETVRKHPKIWQLVAEQLANKEMPPKDKPQPDAAQKAELENWVRATLDQIARERAGDPGPVVLRRLSNSEYTYTVRDLTGVNSLDPAREFPIDGAAGEGFTNTGQSLVMSPSLVTKYLDAAKEIASHAVLLPDGIRFSEHTTRRDWTEEIVTQIREFYREFTDQTGGEKVNLQGVAFETNGGGRLPLEKYLRASLEARDAVSPDVATIARKHGLNAKYLSTLTATLKDSAPSLVLDQIRARWRKAGEQDVAALAADIANWQKALWKFSSVGHIGKVGGPKAWMEPVTPIVSSQDLKAKIAPSGDNREVTLYLVASAAGDGSEQDSVVWNRPRLVAPGKPEILLRDVRALTGHLTERRERILANTAQYLSAAFELGDAKAPVHEAELALRRDLNPDALRAWLAYLGIGSSEQITVKDHLAGKLERTGDYAFIQGWGSPETPNLIANSSDQHVRVPGNMKPHGVAMHPSPTLQVAVGWQSPVGGSFEVQAAVTHAHPECGNGVTWSLELRRGGNRKRLASGIAQGPTPAQIAPIPGVSVRPGDLISLLVGPRDGNHSCDLTAVDLTIAETGNGEKRWNLSADVSPDVLAGNPHADRQGNPEVWHFYTEPNTPSGVFAPVIPPGSLISKWQEATDSAERERIAKEVEKLVTSPSPDGKDTPDAKLYQQLTSLSGPLLSALPLPTTEELTTATTSTWGLDPTTFGRDAEGQPIDATSLGAKAPAILEVRLLAELASGYEFVTTGSLSTASGKEGSVQLELRTTKPENSAADLIPNGTVVTTAGGVWSDNNQKVAVSAPFIVNDGSAARQRILTALDEFRNLFPAALCYTKIVPVDEVVTLTLFHREDDQLSRLMLDADQKARIDRLWDELHFVSQDAFTLVDAYAQLMEYATQDADPKVFEPLRKPITERAASLRQRLAECEPRHVDSIIAFADRACRHPLRESEKGELRVFYQKLREQEIPHDEAIRLTIARVLVAPAFLYRAETPGPGSQQARVNHWELASRLSYFLWSSMPDAQLRTAADKGELASADALVSQAAHMLRDERSRRLAIEFACQWLHIRDFDHLDEKSEKHFPTFTDIRGPMYEESIRFFSDLFQNNGSVLSILDADHTFLNEALAKHYGIPGVSGDEWRRVDNLKSHGRGGVLGLGTTLAKNSGASRTSPILRGNWVAEVLLGDRLPRPPKDVPQLPEDESTAELTVRQLTEKHSADPRCSGCHVRIDGFGFALERFDAIGRSRERDSVNRELDTASKLLDGTSIDGIAGLRDYLLNKRRDAFLRQFCRKLLGYALGRGVQLSDEPLLKEMQVQLADREYRVWAAIETVLRSRQFQEIRGREMTYED